MNRIFKTVWNVARKALVVVNERAGIGQSRCAAREGASESVNSTVAQRIANNRESQFGVPSAVCMALAGVFALWGGNVEAAKTFPTDCASVGGTLKDGVCYIGDGTQTDTVVEEVNDEWTLTEGDMTITGGDLDLVYGIYSNASGPGNTGTISNKGSGTLTIFGGSIGDSNGIEYNAWGSGSGTIVNEGEGTLTISGGNYWGSNGINYNAHGVGSTGTISNEGEGTLTISGGSDTSARGINYNAYGSGSTGIISNTGTGTLAITGGSGSAAYGIEYNAIEGGSGTISNEGEGTLTITGGNGDMAHGVRHNIYGSGNTGIISNTGTGTLTISGGYCWSAYGIQYNAFEGSSGTISNEGEGTLTITGGSASDAYGINYNAFSGGSGTIVNEGEGTVTITGGSSDLAHGIEHNAYSSGSTGTISNIGTGTLTITGGSVCEAYGIEYNAIEGGSGTISNEGEGTLTITGGSSDLAHGIDYNAYGSGSTGIISNTGTGTLTITGGSGYMTIGIVFNADGSGSTAMISNTGLGTLTISGGSITETYGIYNVASDGGTSTLSNSDDGTFVVQNGVGSGIEVGATGTDSTARFVNSGTGDMLIRGSETGTDGNFALHFGSQSGGSIAFENTGEGNIRFQSGIHGNSVWFLANTDGTASISNAGKGSIISEGLHYHNNGIWYLTWIGAHTTVSNTGGGLIAFKGGAEEQSNGLHSSAYGAGTVVEFVNDASTFLIQGGSGESAVGIAHGSGDGSAFNITNRNGGVFTFQGGDNLYSHGLNNAIDRSGTFTVKNEAGSTMNIMGVAGKSNGIANLVAVGGDASIENAGTLNMNSSAIGAFISSATNPATASFTNKSTGTVNAEAEAIFSKTETTVAAPIDICILTAQGEEKTTQTESFQGRRPAWNWDLKNDWSQYSHWEDGGSLVITDVMAGTTSAQQITAAFQEKFGTGTSLTFKGENDDASADMEMPKFSASIANDLITQGYAGAIVTNFDLDVSTEDGTAQSVTVGQSGTNSITDSIGFRQILGASAVSVRGGKTLTLIGTIEGEELVEGGGKVDLNNGKLQLGVDAGSEETTGFLSDVSIVNDSKVTAENGWFRMDSLTGTGEVSVAENGRVYAGEMTVTGSVKNAGTLSADSLNVKGNLESSKTLKTSGTITVDAGSKLSVNGAVIADSIKVDGVVVLGSNAQVYTGAAAMDQLRKQNAEAAAEIDRVEGKAEVNTMSVLDRIVAESMKKMESEETDSNQEKAEESSSGSSSTGTVITSHRRAAPVLPQDAQAFAAFDAVKRIASDIERGTNPDGHGLWVKLQTNESEFGARAGTKFEIDSDGAVIGAEAKLDPSWKVGGAVSYLDGEIDSGLAKNNWTSYGLHGYVQYKEGAFGVKGTAGWLRGTTEAAEDFDADVWHAGVRAEYDLPAGSMTFTPFVGARVLSGSFDGMDSQTAFSLPVGVALSGTLTTGGWTIVPSLEAAYVRSMGDTFAQGDEGRVDGRALVPRRHGRTRL